MGNPRPKPERLGEKLREIRLGLGFSQTKMLKQLGREESMHYGRISEYEGGKRELCHDINLLQILNFRVSTEGLDDRDCAEF